MYAARNGQRTAAIALATPWRSLKLCIVGRTAVHRLPQATCVRRRGRDRQSYRHEHSYQEQYQQQSGCRTMHGFKCSDKSWLQREQQFTSIDQTEVIKLSNLWE